jgi:hypothetical protein
MTDVFDGMLLFAGAQILTLPAKSKGDIPIPMTQGPH